MALVCSLRLCRANLHAGHRRREFASVQDGASQVSDPCDPIPGNVTMYLWARLRLDRETDPHVRSMIKVGMNQDYGRLMRPMVGANDPCDEWSLFVRPKDWYRKMVDAINRDEWDNEYRGDTHDQA